MKHQWDTEKREQGQQTINQLIMNKDVIQYLTTMVAKAHQQAKDHYHFMA